MAIKRAAATHPEIAVVLESLQEIQHSKKDGVSVFTAHVVCPKHLLKF